MLDARPRSFYSVTGAGNNHFTSAREAYDDRANGIVASVTGALGFRDCQLHEPLFRFVGSRDHVDPKLTRTLVTNCYASPPKLPYRPKISPRAPRPQTMRQPCEDSAAPSFKAEYDRGLWRYQLLSPLPSANAGTPIGGVPLRRCSLCLLNLKLGSDNCNSQQGRILPRLSSAPGVSKTGIGAISQNGYLRSGASP